MRPDTERVIGESPSFLRTLEQVSLIAPLEKPVLIVGERGTGKELVAARLHFLSNRWEGQYVKMNCAAISESLLETELFGHEAGAFTGATKTHHGRFERAHGGTLFLDELANTSALVQEKLLRVIEYGEFERVGGNKTLTCDVRIIAATNEDLPRLAADNKFRSDLLDRLAFDVITLPPLREREEDIGLLADYFAVNMVKELGRDLFPGFSQRITDKLQTYDWPGNVRELKNVVERCVYRTEPEDIVDEVVFDPFDSPYRPVKGSQTSQIAAPTNGSLPLDLKEHIKDQEVAFIEQALTENKHNQRKAADVLGLTYHQLRGYLKKYELVGASSEEEATE
ncbi:MAG: psp operon transcriptional activator [Limisphaerales bacterium]|jgi:psp operon transcriptional activator